MNTSRRVFMGMTAASLALGGVKPEKAEGKKAVKNQALNIYDNMVYDAGDAISQWGFSMYITYRGKTILFDAGTFPGILEHNAKALGADLGAVDTAVLSHSHSDHIFGFDYFLKVNKEFMFHVPNGFDTGAKTSVKTPRTKKPGSPGTDMEFTNGFLYRHPRTHIVSGHTDIAEGIHLISTTSTLTGRWLTWRPR